MPQRHAIVRAMFFSVASRVALLAATLAVMPSMLAYLGPGLFSHWVTALSIITMASFLDFGIGNSLLTRLSASYAEQDIVKSRRLTGAAYLLLACVSAGGLLTLFAILGGLAVAGQFAAGWDAHVFVIMALFFLIGLPLQVVQRMIYAQNRVLLHDSLLILISVSSVAVTLAAIQLELAPWLVIFAYSATPAVLLFVVTLWYFLRFPDQRPGLADLEFGTETRDLLRLGKGYLVLAILTGIGMNIDILLMNALLGETIVADYALPARIGTLLVSLVGIMFMPLWSYNGAAFAAQRYRQVARLTLKASIAGGILVMATGLALVLGADLLMSLWTGRSFPDQRAVIATLAVAATIIAVTSPYNMVLNAFGELRIQVLCWIGFVVLSIAIKAVTVPLFGAWVAALVTAVVYGLTVTPFIVIKARRLLDAAQA
jgi:O-antigen/teichoic acid export membrane protein